MCYADLALFNVIMKTESQFPMVFKTMDFIPCLKAYQERMNDRPHIVKYLQSGNSIYSLV